MPVMFVGQRKGLTFQIEKKMFLNIVHDMANTVDNNILHISKILVLFFNVLLIKIT